MTDENWGRPPESSGIPSGFCKLCGRPLDDHDGWLTEAGPKCPKRKDPVKR
jgi:hypothetical protein